MRRLITIAFVLLALVGAAIFGAGSFAAENAIHPPRQKIALSCPCFSHMSCRSVSINATDGVELSAWYYTSDKPNGKVVILLHGIGASRQDMIPLGYLFLHNGYSVLEPDLRGHGDSGGVATYGVLEGGDIHRWVDWMAKNSGSSQIYGFGASLGAAVLLQSLETETRFRAVVAESPYYDFSSIADERIARMLPEGTKWVAGPFVASGITWERWRRGIDLREASPAEGLRHSETPVLLIHGAEDNKTSPENSERLAQAAGKHVVLWIVPGAHHADAWATVKKEFESRVLGWFSTS
ncbi:MAG TPA: alpha/beta fold hydrolase [Bryobacteraceae bacterium]|nr:alpha/beta fold hydrolase [Bryobacteraceae bacterium]